MGRSITSATLAALGLMAALLAAANGPTQAHARDPRCPASLYSGRPADALREARRVEEAIVVCARDVVNSHTSLLCVRTGSREEIQEGANGSGILISCKSKSWILTNEHVIDRARDIYAAGPRIDEREVRVHDRLPRFDLALLDLGTGALKEKPTPAIAGDPELAKPQIGDWVLATGNPFGLCIDGTPAVLRGMITSARRLYRGNAGSCETIQHDARLNPGCSGGALWDLHGRLLGVNGRMQGSAEFAGAQATNAGVTLTTPMPQIVPFLDAMAAPEHAMVGAHGIETRTSLDRRGRACGAEITSIAASGPLADLVEKRSPKRGDVILYVRIAQEKTRVFTSEDFERVLSKSPPGTEVTLRYKRGAANLRWTFRLWGS